MERFLKLKSRMKSCQTPAWWDYIIPGIVFVIAFVCFDQAYDMKLTMLQSSDLLDCIFAGKPFDFYRYTWSIASTAGYLGRFAPISGAIYNIVIYITMAIWALPVYVLNQLFHFAQYANILNIWGRIMVIGLSVLCTFLLSKLSVKAFHDPVESRWSGYLFLTSPILMFCVVIYNQYDIFSVTATLLALLFFFDKKYYKFSMLIALAVCYKLFPVFIFIPLILLVEKRLFKLVQHFIIGLSLYGITTLLWSTFDAGYHITQSEMMPDFGFYQWVFKAEIPGGISNISIFVFCILVISAIAYWMKPKESDLSAFSAFLAGAAYISFFVFVNWHPQWMIVMLPFLIMMLFRMRNRKLALILEIAASIGFILINCIQYLDESIFNETLLVDLFHFTYFGNISNFVMNCFYKTGLTVVLPMTIFSASLFVLLFLSYKEYKQNKEAGIKVEKDISEYRALLYCRTLVPMIYMLFPIIAYFGAYFQK